jgi:glutathione S-transferase
MLTLFHSPKSRSSRVLWLLEELGADYEIEYVSILRQGGVGAVDPKNPHLLKQAPCLEHHGQIIQESVIIWIYLTDLYPQASLAPRPGDARRAEYLAWLGLYNAVLEPVVTAVFSDAGPSPVQKEAFAGLVAKWKGALEAGPYLMGETFTAVDILFASLLHFSRKALPDDAIFDEWLNRISARPALALAMTKDEPR